MTYASPYRTLMGLTRRAPEPDHRVTEDSVFVAMLWRQLRALEARSCDNAELIPQVVAIAQRAAEIVNVAISENAAAFAVDPRYGASLRECSRLLGIKSSSAHDRKVLGDRIVAARLADAGVVDLRRRVAKGRKSRAKTTPSVYVGAAAEAARERAAIQRAATFADDQLAAYRTRRTRVA